MFGSVRCFQREQILSSGGSRPESKRWSTEPSQKYPYKLEAATLRATLARVNTIGNPPRDVQSQLINFDLMKAYGEPELLYV